MFGDERLFDQPYMRALSTEPCGCTADVPRSASFPVPAGGMLWFVDLTVSDSSLMLPIIGTVCTYAGLELAKMKGATGWIKVRSLLCSLVRPLAVSGIILFFVFFAPLQWAHPPPLPPRGYIHAYVAFSSYPAWELIHLIIYT